MEEKKESVNRRNRLLVSLNLNNPAGTDLLHPGSVTYVTYIHPRIV